MAVHHKACWFTLLCTGYVAFLAIVFAPVTPPSQFGGIVEHLQRFAEAHNFTFTKFDGENKTSFHIPLLTFNIRWADLNNLEDQGPYSWPARRMRVASIIRKLSPWVVGIQEALAMQHNDLLSLVNSPDPQVPPPRWGERRVENYRSVGMWQGAILWRPDTLRLLGFSRFWLSDTPHTESVSWGSLSPRHSTYARFRTIKEKFEFAVLNTHMDPRSEEARRRGVEVLQRYVEEASDGGRLPVFLLGDFNSAPGQVAHELLTGQTANPLHDAWEDCEERVTCTIPAEGNVVSTYHHYYGPHLTNSLGAQAVIYAGLTVHGNLYPPKSAARQHIDWVLYRNGTEGTATPVYMAVVVEEHDWQAQYASDHFPVVAVMEMTSLRR